MKLVSENFTTLLNAPCSPAMPQTLSPRKAPHNPYKRLCFMQAEWRDLVVANWEVPDALLQPFVPAGTELDHFEGKSYVSLVAFRFEKTSLFQVPIPFHTTFEEVNLRFYVTRTVGNQIRRAAVFIKEIAPRRAVCFVARNLYGENYIYHPMGHRVERTPSQTSVSYYWGNQGAFNVDRSNPDKCPYEVSMKTSQDLAIPSSDSEAHFIIEHYWGYAAQRNAKTIEYEVHHDPWRVSEIDDYSLRGDWNKLYGAEFGKVLDQSPDSIFFVEGSPIEVLWARKVA